MNRVARLFLAAALLTVAAPACQKSAATQGPCVAGTVLRGKTPPDGTAQWCVKEGTSTKEGKWTEWYPTGKLKSEGQYVDGKMDGAWVSYHEDGKTKKEEGKFIAGLKDGLWTSWHEDGNKKRESLHKAGSWEVTWIAFRDGTKKWAEGVLVGAQENGSYTEWHPNGQLAAKGSFKNGQKNNDWEYFDDKGVPSEDPQGDFAATK